jgi:hypothetical protein
VNESGGGLHEKALADISPGLLALLFGCGTGSAKIRNTDDGKLRVDERYCIEFLVDTATERITGISYTLDV